METIEVREIYTGDIKLKQEKTRPVIVARREYVSYAKPYYGKRALDVVLACLLTVLLLSWLTPLLLVLIKLDSRGALFFRQKRAGKNGTVFNCLKFRTMHPNATSDLVQAADNDERITTIGRVLRKFHIDELPQLINIIKGDMSFVGPRPHMLSDEETFSSVVPQYVLRQCVRPGLTGLAQVKGFHGSTPDYHSIYFRVKLDHFYVYNLSPLLDLKIMLSTLFIPFSK